MRGNSHYSADFEIPGESRALRVFIDECCDKYGGGVFLIIRIVSNMVQSLIESQTLN